MNNQRLVAASLSVAVASTLHAQIRVYVDDDAPDGGNGLSWDSAMNDLQEAIDLAETLGSSRGEVRIAGGVYKPDQGTGDRTRFFSVPGPGLSEPPFKVIGGFAGWSNQSSPNTRNTTFYPTVISGDLNNDDLSGGVNTEDNSERLLEFGHAVAGTGSVTSGVVLDGLRFHGAVKHAVQNAGTDVYTRIRHCDFIENHGLEGSALKLNDAVVAVSACTFKLNSSIGLTTYARPAGALHASDSVLVVSVCEFEENTATSGNGGGIAAVESRVIVEQSEFNDNSADRGGGLYFRSLADESNDPLDVRDCSFQSNSAGQGGGLHTEGRVYIVSSSIRNNTALSGGGIGGRYRIVESTIENNVATINGGGLMMNGSAHAYLCTIINNQANGGGGVFGPFGAGSLDSCNVIGNHAADDGGGVMGGKSIVDSDFVGNTAGGRGGGASETEYISETLFESNSAQTGGGYFNESTNFVGVIADSAFLDNSATGSGSSVRIANGASVDLIRSALVRSGSPLGLGSFVVDAGYAWVESSIVWDEEQHDDPAIILDQSVAAFLHSNFRQNDEAFHFIGDSDTMYLSENVHADPLFVDAAGGDISLSPGSPCIDRGYHSTFPELPNNDIYGFDRESLDDAGVINLGFGITKTLDIGPVEFRGTSCLADVNGDGDLTPTDFSAWVGAYQRGDAIADQNRDGDLTPTDFSAWVNNYTNGC